MARHLLRISLCFGEARKRELLIDPTRRQYPSWGGVLNLMDPGLIPPQLPELTMAEEMLIAGAHVQMDISRVRGCQYKYKRHVISWMRNIPKMVQRLPSRPSELQILMVKPTSINRLNSEASRQIQRRFRVRRGPVQAWLAYLIVNHPDYQTVTIDPTQLAQLPEDGSIIDDVQTVPDDDEDENNENKEVQGQPTESEQPSGGIWPKSTPVPPYSPHMPSIRACEEAPPVETSAERPSSQHLPWSLATTSSPTTSNADWVV